MKGLIARRARGLWWATAVLVALFALWHAQSMDRYLDRVSAERFEGEETVLPRERIQGGSALDGMTWIRVSANMASEGEWRFRDTNTDNAPTGRPVFWSSGWAWWLIASGKAWAAATGLSFEHALERVARWGQVPVLICLMVILGGWVSRRWGGWAASVLAVGMLGHRAFYEGFLSGNPDHHGVIAGGGTGMVMGVLMAGAGWFRARANTTEHDADALIPHDPESVARGMKISALFGGVGMWFSAASMIPVIATVGVVSVVVGVMMRRKLSEAGLTVVPSAWRLWGRAGALLSISFYLLENFPDRLGWKLEINHPCHALAWLGAGECIALIMEWLAGTRRSGAQRAIRWSAVVVLVTGPVLVLAWGGARLFTPADPFVVEVYRYVSELSSLPARIAKMGYWYYVDYAGLHLWLLVLAGGLWWAARSASARLLVATAGGAAALLMILGWWQIRWLAIAAGPLVLLAALMVAVVSFAVKSKWRRGTVVLLIVPVFFVTPWRMVGERALVEKKADVQPLEAMQLLYRDIARVLRADAQGRPMVVLSSPDGSVSISYYADAASVGTLYWENVEGMKRAGALYAAKDDASALAGLKEAGVTHIAMLSLDNGIAEYVAAMRAQGADATIEEAFASRLLEGRAAPLWLRPVEYVVPPQFARLAPRVRLYALDETQSPAEAHYRHGIAFAVRKDYENALRHFWEASSLAPDMPGPWFRIAEVLLARREYAEACDMMIMGARLVAEAHQAEVYREAAALFERHGAKAEAARLRDMASTAP